MYSLRARVRMYVICVASYISFNVILSNGIFHSCVALLLLLSFLYSLCRFISFLSARSKWIDRHTYTYRTTGGQFLKRKTFAHSIYKIHIHHNACNQFDLNQHRVNVTSWTRASNNFSDSMFIAIDKIREMNNFWKFQINFHNLSLLGQFVSFPVEVYGLYCIGKVFKKWLIEIDE